MLIAFRVAEDERVLLPAMVGLDAFILTHTFEPVDVPEQREVDDFLPPYRPKHAYLDPERPITQGSFVYPEYYMEFKYGQWIAMESARDVIDEVFADFASRFGRKYEKVSTFMCDDAEIVLITMGSLSGTVRHVVRELRNEGIKVGVAKITVFRPFPHKEIIRAVKNAKVVGVLEKNVSFGFGGAVYGEVLATVHGEGLDTKVLDFIVGLGGRDVRVEDVKEVVKICSDALQGKAVDKINWINVDKEAVKNA